MEILLAILVGVLYAAGVYMLLSRSILKFNATNLLVFIASGITNGKPAFINNNIHNTEVVADPLPQAMVLTAIVIGFGIVVFTLALKYKFFQRTGTDDLDQLKQTDD